MRERAAAALIKLKADVPLNKVIPLKRDSIINTRISMVKIIGNSSDKAEAAQHLLKLTQEDENPGVRKYAERELEKLRDKTQETEYAE